MLFMTADSSSQWNGDGIHKITGTKYDELRFDMEGNNRRVLTKMEFIKLLTKSGMRKIMITDCFTRSQGSTNTLEQSVLMTGMT